MKGFHGALICGLTLLLAACAEPTEQPSEGEIQIGAVLPFTGNEAAIGRNLEQAMLLAQEDVNRAGGVGGKPLRLISRDSNSGSERGLDATLELLYLDQVKYLVGPEETELVNAIVPDVRALDVLNILPGYAAPTIRRATSRGAWLHLAPSASAMGCGLAKQAFLDGVRSVAAIVMLDDYDQSLFAEFNGKFGALGGENLPSVTVKADASSYLPAIRRAFGYGADRTFLIAYPATASRIVTDWQVSGRGGSWTLGPMLRAEGFLLNTPHGSLDGYSGLSPSLSLPSECAVRDGAAQGSTDCTRDNARSFARHFAERWDGAVPFPAAHFYYDAVVILALGLEYALAKDGQLPTPAKLRNYVRELSEELTEVARWTDLGSALSKLASGEKLRYVGAAAEYQFDEYGEAKHVVFDTWKVERRSFVESGALMAACPRNF